MLLICLYRPVLIYRQLKVILRYTHSPGLLSQDVGYFFIFFFVIVTFNASPSKWQHSCAVVGDPCWEASSWPDMNSQYILVVCHIYGIVAWLWWGRLRMAFWVWVVFPDNKEDMWRRNLVNRSVDFCLTGSVFIQTILANVSSCV